MEKMRVLLANDPRVYREVIADALRELRPLIEVVVCGPGELDLEVSRFRPHLVICSEASVAVRSSSPAWMLLYPDGEDRAEVGGAGLGGGASFPMGSAKVSDLLALVDETERSLAPAGGIEESSIEG